VRDFYQPLKGLPLESSVSAKTVYTGYLQRLHEYASEEDMIPDSPYLLVTPGGGRDGRELIDLIVSAYTRTPSLPYHAVVVLGPFMHSDSRQNFHKQVAAMENITLLDFHPRMESLILGAAGMITMGGYNTFCEILSFDKPALLFPRVRPRTEQLIRFQRADQLGMLTMLDPDSITVEKLTQYVENFDTLPRPSNHFLPGMLEGMNTITQRMIELLPDERIRPIVTPLEHAADRPVN